MKYLILAAGRGSRMGLYTKQEPKILLRFGRYNLLGYHIMYASLANIQNVVLVKGYRGGLIKDMKYYKQYTNPDYDDTNMVYSLMLARDEFDDDIIVAYGDILYEPDYLKKLIRTKGDFVVSVDINWEKYWEMRYGYLTDDLESLLINEKGFIVDIGQSVRHDEIIDARYVGLLKFTKKGLKKICKLYDENPEIWRKAYMTDLLQELIERGEKIVPYKVRNGWLEFDTEKDYVQAVGWMADGTLKKELNLVV